MKKVSIERKRYILDDFFKIEEAYVQFEQFNGEMSPLVRQLTLERGQFCSRSCFQQKHGKINPDPPVQIPYIPKQPRLDDRNYCRNGGLR